MGQQLASGNTWCSELEVWAAPSDIASSIAMASCSWACRLVNQCTSWFMSGANRFLATCKQANASQSSTNVEKQIPSKMKTQ